MRHMIPGEWRYFLNMNGTYTVCPINLRPGREVVATVMREEDARLISAAPELWQALTLAVKTLRADEAFMADKGMDTDDLSEIVRVIGGVLDRLDRTE